jgi:subtilisin-like proprotein convertase family protein
VGYRLMGDDLLFAQDELGDKNWDALWAEMCAEYPDAPECERPPNVEASKMEFQAQAELARLMDVSHPPLGNGTPLTYTITLVNRGAAPAQDLSLSVVTWGPVRLPGGDTYQDANDQFDWLDYDVGTLAPEEVRVITFPGEIDIAFDPNNNEGWATIDALLSGYLGGWEYGQIDSLYMDHEVDQTAPDYVEIQTPQDIIGVNAQNVRGFVFDQSDVPAFNLTLSGDAGGSFACADTSAAYHAWTCPITLTGVSEGDSVQLTVQATDQFGQSSAPFAGRDLVVDATPPDLTLDETSLANLSDGWLGPNEVVLSGQLSDNRLLGSVEICDPATGGCDAATLFAEAFDPTYVYIDSPAAPLTIDAGADCAGGAALARTFVVTNSLTVADLDVSLRISHTFRNDLRVTLHAPSGVSATLVSLTANAENLDIRLDDAQSTPVHHRWDKEDHDVGLPHYDNARRPYPDTLARFNGQSAAGEWRLEICDQYPAEDDGAYLSAQLHLRPVALPENDSAPWLYDLALPDNIEGVSQTRELYGADSVGNRTTAPLTLNYLIDTRAPTLTQTWQSVSSGLVLHQVEMSGIVSDINPISLTLIVYTPSGDLITRSLEYPNNTWSYSDLTVETYIITNTVVVTDAQGITETVEITETGVYSYNQIYSEFGLYTHRLEALDSVGNQSVAGPFEVLISEPSNIYLPLILKNYTPPPPAPDLVIQRLIATTQSVTLTVKNVGSLPSEEAFWVDLYVNPNPPPTEVNQSWQMLAEQGATWGVETSLGAGEVLTLTLDSPTLWAEYSDITFPLTDDAQIYVQVDSLNFETSYGAILEQHEMIGGAYNNIVGPLSPGEVHEADIPLSSVSSGQSGQALNKRLPFRGEVAPTPTPVISATMTPTATITPVELPTAILTPTIVPAPAETPTPQVTPTIIVIPTLKPKLTPVIEPTPASNF